MHSDQTTPGQPESSTPTPAGTPSIRVGRWEVGVNVVLQIILVFTALIVVNFLGNRFYARWNWSSSNQWDLSPQTRAVLTSLQKPVHVVVFFSSAGEVEGDARSLLREYEFAAAGKLSIEDVDPDANLSRAKELQAKYKFGGLENVIILDYDGNSKFISSGDMAEWAPMDEMSRMMRKQPELIGFKGEQVLTSALIDITEPKKNKLYVVSGHSEFAATDPEIRGLIYYLTRQNFATEPLQLADVTAIPSDANALLILNPRSDFSQRDLGLLTDYFDRKGSIFIATSPTSKGDGAKPRFNKWLADFGVSPQEDVVLRVERVLNQLKSVELAGILTGKSKITDQLEGTEIPLLGPTQSLLLDKTKEQTGQLKITPLMLAPQGFWGETEFAANNPDLLTFDPNKDHRPPLILAASVEKGASRDPNVKIETARLIVIGNGIYCTDKGLIYAGDAALNFTNAATNWAIKREHLIAIPPKIKDRISLSLSEAQLQSIRLWVCLIIPLIVAVLGIYHWCWRHGRNLLVLTMWLAIAYATIITLWSALLWYLNIEEIAHPIGLLLRLGIAAIVVAFTLITNHFESKRRSAALKK